MTTRPDSPYESSAHAEHAVSPRPLLLAAPASAGSEHAVYDTALPLMLLNVAARLTAIPDLATLLAHLVPLVVEALPAVDGGMLWLYDRRIGKLQATTSSGLPLEPSTQRDLERCQVGVGEALAGQAFQHRRIVHAASHTGYANLADYSTPANKALAQQLSDQMPRALLVVCLPLLAADTSTETEAVGVLELFCFAPAHEESTPPRPPDILTPAVSHLLHTFASIVGAAITNAQRDEERQRHAQRLNAFDAVVTAINAATDLGDLMRSVLDVVLTLLPVHSGAILLLDPAHARLTPGAHRCLPSSYVEHIQSLPVESAPCAEVIQYGQPMLRPLLEERGEDLLLAAGLESCAYFPLLAGGTVVGVLALFGDARLPREIDSERLMPLSNQVGFAIANVRLYEESLLERRKLNTIINSIAEGVVLCNSQGRLVLANEAAVALLNLDSIPFHQPLSEMSDFYAIRDLEGTPLPEDALPMARALAGEVFHDYRVLLRGASGSNSVMSFSGAPTRTDDISTIEGAVVIFRDITASQKLERAKDEFLAEAAHELRSPLAAVRGYASMLLERQKQRGEMSERDMRGLIILSQQVTHMLRMVDNLLDVSRLDAGRIELQLQQVNLISLASQVLDQQRPGAGSHELLLEHEQPELPLLCDSLRIRQVLTNLVGNAIKYSPPDTPITVYLKTGEDEACPVVLVSIADRGNPIPLEQQKRLFARFYRGGGRRAEGLGLGLYLSYEFVQMHGGRIWLESIEGKGNTFFFTLPLRTAAAPETQPLA